MDQGITNNLTRTNPIADWEEVTPDAYLEFYSTRINQESEQLFVRDFLYPLLGKNLKHVIPQYPFLDSEGRSRRIDFAVVNGEKKLALEVNGETYHAEGIVTNEVFDDNLNRQNEILGAGYRLLRFSYSQLQSQIWRPRVSTSIRKLFYQIHPDLLPHRNVNPNPLQERGLEALDFYRSQGWKRGIVILPTGTGKTFLSAFDTQKVAGRILFVAHRLELLSQAKESFSIVYPNEIVGTLTGEVQENLLESKILFASKDSLRNPTILEKFRSDEFDYIIVDEVHHGQAPSYRAVLDYFHPPFFMLGLTATPDRTDRKDIFELFDYQKVYEITLSEAIENGYLVPYTYYGLKDNIDYSNIRHNGNKYVVADLDRHLIIKERNEQILKEYLEKGQSNKGLGFCASIKHAEAMADFFNANGIPSFAITSETPDRGELIKKFRKNEFNVAFTVDLFNEGVDFPDLRVLMFLRPTESKTVFMQQLGRGLRLCNGKDNVVILDFIGNYKKANNIRKYLAKGSKEQVDPKTGRVEKIIYEFAPGCEVHFEAEVETLIDAQDTQEREITKEDLIAAYHVVAESIERKPTQAEINEKGEFKVGKYLAVFGTWVKFLYEIGEYTEASYHFPQGTHLGHIFFILKTLSSGNVEGTQIAPEYVKFRGGYSEGRAGSLERQMKYKLQAAMEMGLIVDFRTIREDEEFKLQLTPKGKAFSEMLRPFLENEDFSFKDKGDPIPSTEMERDDYGISLKHFLDENPDKWEYVAKAFFEMHAVGLMLNYLYRIGRAKDLSKASIYDNFFKAPFVSAYCDQNGIDTATESAAVRRCPFLLNILESLGVISQSRQNVHVLQFLASPQTMKLHNKEADAIISARIDTLIHHPETFKEDEISLLKETFGKEFLTEEYNIQPFKELY